MAVKSRAGGGRGGGAGGGPLKTAVPEGSRVRWHDDLGVEARAEPNNDVLIGPEFFNLSKEVQADVLAHEYGHVLEQMDGSLRAGKPFDRAMESLGQPIPPAFERGGVQWYGYGGNTRVTEAFSDAFMSYARNPEGLRASNPKVFRYMRTIVNRNPAFRNVDWDGIVTQLKPGPRHGLMTIFDEH